MSKINISKRIKDILNTATPRQKALLICRDWIDKNTLDKQPLLTDEEARAIRDSLKLDTDKQEFNKWLNVYNVYREITPFFGLVYKEYQAEAEKIVGYLRQWEAYNNEENHLIALYESIKATGNKVAEEAFIKTLKELPFTYAKLEIDEEDGYPKINLDALIDIIKDHITILIGSYEVAKAMVIVLERYTKKTRSKDFCPEIVKDTIALIKEDYAQRVSPQYSRKELKAKRDKGEAPTPEELRKAIYPYYEEITAPDNSIELFQDKLNLIIKSYE